MHKKTIGPILQIVARFIIFAYLYVTWQSGPPTTATKKSIFSQECRLKYKVRMCVILSYYFYRTRGVFDQCRDFQVDFMILSLIEHSFLVQRDREIEWLVAQFVMVFYRNCRPPYKSDTRNASTDDSNTCRHTLFQYHPSLSFTHPIYLVTSRFQCIHSSRARAHTRDSRIQNIHNKRNYNQTTFEHSCASSTDSRYSFCIT